MYNINPNRRLSDNQIHSLPSEIKNLKRLELLYIDNNKLEFIQSEIGELLFLKKL